MDQTHHILLVEDSRTEAVLLENVLAKEHWQVHWAATAEAAIEQIDVRVPDLIVLDYYLPGIRGDELCRRIRMNLGTRHIPILMLTADDTRGAQIRGFEGGADGFVSKSMDTQILLARIRALLAKPRTHLPMCGQTVEPLRQAHLLTIDDSVTYQEFLNCELATEGYRIERAMSGSEGLARMARESFDCVLVDLVMPGLNGIDVCRQIDQLRESTNDLVTVLMLTGRENKDDLTRALEAGADDFVGKSSDMAVLKGRIRALLRRKLFQEENRRILKELKNRELEAIRSQAEKEAAEARAALNVELEQRVRQRTAELAEVNRDLTQKNQENEMFVYSVSHDLRSPLVNLQGFSNELGLACGEIRTILADGDVPPPLQQRGFALVDNEMNDSIHFIQNAVTRMGLIIESLLRLSRVGRVEYQLQQVDVQPIAVRIVEAMHGTINDRQASVTLRTLPPAWGDLPSIEQIVSNLVGNALKYLDPDRPGRIEIGALEPNASEGASTGPRLQTYFVRDNGLGIAESYRNKVFQVFQRLHPQVAEGEGMGLAIVRRLVERHGGKIWFESAVGVGTTFYFTLPAPPSI